jgi:hypothetical protein
MSFVNKVSTLRHLSGRQRRLLCEAVICLAVARLSVVLIPARFLTAWLANCPRTATDSTGQALLREIRFAVITAARNVPWNAVCLPQAIAGKFMLARRGCASTLRLGVARTPAGGLLAHAWLEADGQIVVGELGVRGITQVARFG